MFGQRLPEILYFKTQADDETGAIPELVGQDGVKSTSVAQHRVGGPCDC